MSREDHVVAAALSYVHVYEAGSHAQVVEAMDNLRRARDALLAQDARREKPRWQHRASMTLGLPGADECPGCGEPQCPGGVGCPRPETTHNLDPCPLCPHDMAMHDPMSCEGDQGACPCKHWPSGEETDGEAEP